MTEFVIEGVVAGYGEDDTVLDDVTVATRDGSIAVLLGPNGSGKSTTLRAAMGLLALRQGRIRLDTADITSRRPEERLAAGIGFLPQGRTAFPSMTVRDNLDMGAWILRRDRRARAAAVRAVLERYPQLADLTDRAAGSLSGGQQRLLEIARMAVADPRVVLIDEPGAGLAPKFADEVYAEIIRLRDEGRAILLVDQNVRAAMQIADHVYVLELGRMRAQGPATDFEGRLAGVVRDWLRLDAHGGQSPSFEGA